MNRPPPSTARTLLLLAGLGARRFLNRLSAWSRRRRPKGRANDAGRAATPPKSGRGLFLLLVFFFLFLPQGIFMSSFLLGKIAALAEARVDDEGKLSVRSLTLWKLRDVDRRIETLSKLRETGSVERGEERLEEYLDEARRILHWEVRSDRRYRAREEAAEENVEKDARDDGEDDAEEAGEGAGGSDPENAGEPELTEDVLREFSLNEEGRRRHEELVEVFRERGAGGFQAVRRVVWLDSSIWPPPEREPLMLAGLGLFLAWLVVALFVMTLGSANQDLGRSEWSFEWLFTFPVKTSALLAAKAIEFTLINAFSWFTVFPFALAALLSSGHAGWWSLPLALAVTLYTNLLLASCRLAAESWLRKNVSLARLKNLQALFTVTGILAFYGCLYLAIGEELPEWFSSATRAASPWILWLPPALPLRLCGADAEPLVELAGLLATGAVFLLGGTLVASRVVRDGLVTTSGGAYRGRRGREREPHALRGTGILAKDLILLRRDRNFLVQTLVVPVLILGFQALVNPALFEAGKADFRHGAAFAFGTGAYVLMFGGFSVLTSEGKSLWLLFTFPRPLLDLMRRKAWLWAGVSALYVSVVLGVVIIRAGGLDLQGAGACLMALLGAAIYAFVASGIGILGTDPLEQEVRRKVRPGMFYLYMLLSSMYAYGIYAPGVWPKTALLVLTSLLAYALWQKVRDRLPYLLDPTGTPPPRIGLSDGMIAALAFFAIQGTLTLVLFGPAEPDATLRSGGRLLIAYVTAGAVVVSGALLLIRRAGVPRPLEAVGLRRTPGRSSVPRAASTGFLFGSAAALLGLVYLKAIELVPALREMKEQALELSRVEGSGLWWTLAALAVLAAPAVEEFIFRGLLFRGLRRSLPLWVSVVASAAVFAIVHPPVSAVPVFTLGVAAALSFERTGLLVAPVVAHMVYNGAVVGFGQVI